MRNRYALTRRTSSIVGFAVLLSAAVSNSLVADQPELPKTAASDKKQTLTVSLTANQARTLDRTVDSGLEFLATQQARDGSFKTMSYAQPAVTSFCIMAFLSRGHLPNQGPYGKQISHAIKYVISKQHPNGLFFAERAGTETWKMMGSYNHAISGVMLGEVYGMTGPQNQKAVRTAIKKGLLFSRQQQTQRKRWHDDRGGWRYLLPSSAIDADLSLTAWHLMFYRSAKNAEFDVSPQQTEDAVAYVERCFDSRHGAFAYGLRGYGRNSFSRSMAGAGIVSLALGGKHQTAMVQRAGRFILDHPFDRFNRGGLTPEDRFYYGAYYCSQAMFQLGGEYWERFYPILLETMVQNQRENGSWEREANQDGQLGCAYSTSLAILSLTPPYQLLPIYQR